MVAFICIYMQSSVTERLLLHAYFIEHKTGTTKSSTQEINTLFFGKVFCLIHDVLEPDITV